MKDQNLFSKDFTLVVLGQIISLFGNAILRFALPLYLLRETGSATLFGIVTACSFLPMIILSFLGGVLADRTNKRNIMVILDFLTALIIIVLCLTLDTLPIVPLFIVILMLLYGISGTYQPTVQASIPALVSTNNILPAGAIINQIGALANLLGPILGGILFGSFGIMPILLISILCFILSAVMELFIHIPYTKRIKQESLTTIIKNDFRDSWSYLKTENPILLKIMALIAAFNLVLTALLIVGLPLLIIDTLQMNDSLLGFAQGALALGGLCGGILVGTIGKNMTLEKSPLILSLCSGGVLIMALPLLFNLTPFVCYIIITLMSFIIMSLATMFSIQMLATVQMQTPPELVGKVIALMMAFAMCAQPIGQALYGVAFEQLKNTPGIILLCAGFISLPIALISKKIFQNLKA